MSGVTSAQTSQEVSGVDSMRDLQKNTSLHGRAFHKISDGGKVIIQSINNIAQSVLSKCIWIVSFGRYNLDSLKSYLFSNQTALKGNETASSSNSPMRAPPPPPPPGDLNKVSPINRSSSVRMQVTSFQSPIVSEAQNNSPDVRSSVNSTQGSSQEDSTTLTLGGGPISSSSLDRDANHVPVQEHSESNHEEVKSKNRPGFMDVSKDSVVSALKNLRKTKNKANQEQLS